MRWILASLALVLVSCLIEDVEQRLREEAAKLGASAVFVVRDLVVPYNSRKLIGVAIRNRQ
jgi:hypothetical protein